MAVKRHWLLIFAISSAVLKAESSLYSELTSTTKDIINLCPYSDLCRQKASRRIDDPDLQPCCQPCSCSPDCASIRNCCPDAVDVTTPTKVYPCRTQPEIYSEYLNVDNRHYVTINRYRVVDGCPEEAFINQLLEEDVAHCYNATEIEDLIFVTGSTSRLTYLNKHCAICNNEIEYVPWTLYLFENHVSNGVSFEERDRSILAHGGVVSVPPSAHISMTAICHVDIYTSCNQSKTWDFYDEEINRQFTTSSKQSEFVDFPEFPDVAVTYANVYCFICNNPRETVVPSQCNAISTSPLDIQTSEAVPFSALIVMRQAKAAPPAPECKDDEWLDPFRRKCAVLLCPDTSIALNGECSRLVKDVKGYQMVAYMAIQLLNGRDITVVDSNKIFQSMSNFVLKQFNFSCDMCYMILTNWTTDSLCMRINLLSNAECSIGYLLKGFAKLFPSPSIEIHLDGGQGQQILNVTNITPKPLYQYLAETVYLACEENNVLLVNETITCPTVELTQDELRYFDDYARVAGMIAAQSRHIGDGTLRICIEEYVAILKATGLISGTGKPNCPLYVAVVLTILRSLYKHC